MVPGATRVLPLPPRGLPGAAELTRKAATSDSVIVYQPYAGPEQRSLVHDLAIPFDLSFNSDPEVREYEILKALHAHHRAVGLDKGAFWGLLSNKFEIKSASSFPAFLDEARSARTQGADCYLYNPMIGCASIYLNVHEHARFSGQPGIEAVLQHLADIRYPVGEPQGTNKFFLRNYVCGNETFWTGYFRFCDTVIAKLNAQAAKGTPAGVAYRGAGSQPGEASAIMRSAVVERLLGYYMEQAAERGLKIVAHQPTGEDFEWKFGRRMGGLLHRLYDLKQTAIDEDNANAAQAWSEGRLPLVKAPQLVWQMDDPPDWMPRSSGAPATSPLKPAPQPAGNTGPAHLQPFAGGWEKHRDRHCIWIVSPQNYQHSRAFDEVALALSGAFEELGGRAPLVTGMRQFNGRAPIIYGAHLLPPEAIPHLPKDSVIINLEQVTEESTWFNSDYMSFLKQFPVLDYSPRNRDNLRRMGITHAGLMEIGYHRSLTRIKPAAQQDVDVLFYGSLNDHRIKILNGLHEAGLKIVHLFDVYGRSRDDMIARAKVVINLHQFKSGVFEIVRVSYLLANSVCVLTEGNPSDPDIEPFLGGLAIEPYENLVERCRALVAAPAERAAIAKAGFEAMSQRSQAAMLKAAMESTGP
ncbi:glycosyltransferase family 1 protein [Xanthobacter sediminis]